MSLPETMLDISVPYIDPYRCSTRRFRVQQIKPWLLEIWEPLDTKAPGPNLAQPCCCYLNTVIFYVRPYTVRPWHHLWSTEYATPDNYDKPRKFTRWKAEKPGSGLEEWDRAEHHLMFDVRFNYNGDVFDCGGGEVHWIGKRWWMKHYARRVKVDAA